MIVSRSNQDEKIQGIQGILEGDGVHIQEDGHVEVEDTEVEEGGIEGTETWNRSMKVDHWRSVVHGRYPDNDHLKVYWYSGWV